MNCACRRSSVSDDAWWTMKHCPLCEADKQRLQVRRRPDFMQLKNGDGKGYTLAADIFQTVDGIGNILRERWGIGTNHDGEDTSMFIQTKDGGRWWFTPSRENSGGWGDYVPYSKVLEWLPAECRELLKAYVALYPMYYHTNRVC